MENNIIDLSKKEAASILNEGVKIIFENKAGKKVEYLLTRLKLGTMLRISKRAVNIERGLLAAPMAISDIFLHLLRENVDDAIYCIACAITNEKKEPSQEVIEQIKWSMDSEMMAKILAIIISMMDAQSFTSGIISMIGLDILTGMNPES